MSAHEMTTPHKGTVALALGLLATGVFAPGDLQPSERRQVGESENPTGMLLETSPFGDQEMLTPRCSAVAVSETLALTAGHCISRDKFYKVFWPSEGIVELSDAPEVHENYNAGGLGPENDLAILKLGKHLASVVPARLGDYAGQSTGLMEGFTVPESEDSWKGAAGLRVRTPVAFRRDHNESDESLLSIERSESLICAGNSGGALLVEAEQGPLLVGILSKATTGAKKDGRPRDCYPYAFAARLSSSSFQDWLKRNGVGIPAQTKSAGQGVVSQRGSPSSILLVGFGTIDSHRISVSDQADEILISVNGRFAFEGDSLHCVDNVHVRLSGAQGEVAGDGIVGPVWSWRAKVRPAWVESGLDLEITTPRSLHPACTGVTYEYRWRSFQFAS